MKSFSKKLMAVSVVLAAGTASTMALAGTTAMTSITPQKIIGNGPSQNIALSKGGLKAVFESDANNFVLQDGNNARDIFMRSGTAITRLSVNSLGQEAKNSRVDWFDGTDDADSTNAAISPDGKLVVFQSQADNLDRLTADTNNVNNAESDIFLRDVIKKKTYRLSGILDGADGITPDQLDVDGNDIVSTEEAWKIMGQGNDQSTNPVIVGTLKAGWVGFQSEATNLATIATTANRRHIYVVDLNTKKLELISATHDVNGNPVAEGNNNSSNAAISPDGRFVVYQSDATNLLTAPITPTSVSTDIFIYDRKMFTTYQLSGVLGAVSPTNGFTVVTEADDDSAVPSITGGGKSKTKSYMIAFESSASDLELIPIGDSGNDRDIFAVEFAAVDAQDANSAYEIKTVTRVSAPVDVITGLPMGESQFELDGTASTSQQPVIAGTNLAYTVAFRSDADNLLAVDPLFPYWNEDSNSVDDIYVYSSKTKLFTRANVDTVGQQLGRDALNTALSPDGKAVGFDTDDEFIVPDVYGNDGTDTQVYIRKL